MQVWSVSLSDTILLRANTACTTQRLQQTRNQNMHPHITLKALRDSNPPTKLNKLKALVLDESYKTTPLSMDTFI